MNLPQSRFIALTPDPRFWGNRSQQEITFLGPWCKTKDLGIDQKYLDDPYLDQRGIIQGQKECNDLFLKYLPLVSEALNKAHNKKWTDRQWQIVCGGWLFWVIMPLHHRVLVLKNLLEKFPEFDTILLSDDSFVTPHDLLHHILLIRGDFYNHQLFSLILPLFGKQFPSLAAKAPELPEHFKQFRQKTGLKGKLKDCGILPTKYIFSSDVFIHKTGFKDQALLKLFLSSGGKIGTYFDRTAPYEIGQSLEEERRSSMFTDLPEGTVIEKALKICLPKLLPLSLLEDFAKIEIAADSHFPRKVKKVFSEVGWYFDEPFKVWAANQRGKKVKIISGQHGGSYGSSMVKPERWQESLLGDKYMTWGWVGDDQEVRLKAEPFFSAKLSQGLANCQKRQKAKSSRRILYTTTAELRYFFAFPFNDNHQRYYEMQLKFFSAISEKIKEDLYFRPFPEEFGQAPPKELSNILKNIKIDQKNPFLDSLFSSGFYISDHLSTTFLEVMALNHPMMIMFQDNQVTLSEEARPFYSALEQEQVLFRDPLAAARFLEKLDGAYNDWWMEKDRQAVVKEFTQKFARAEAQFAGKWRKKLLSL